MKNDGNVVFKRKDSKSRDCCILSSYAERESMEIKLTYKNFNQEVKDSKIPVLVDFWATWCGPCQMVAPVVKALAHEYNGKLKVCKVNVDEESELAGTYGVMSIPTFMIFKDGKVVETFAGALPKPQLVGKILPYLKS